MDKISALRARDTYEYIAGFSTLLIHCDSPEFDIGTAFWGMGIVREPFVVLRAVSAPYYRSDAYMGSELFIEDVSYGFLPPRDCNFGESMLLITSEKRAVLKPMFGVVREQRTILLGLDFYYERKLP